MLTELIGSSRNHVVNVNPFSYGHLAIGGRTTACMHENKENRIFCLCKKRIWTCTQHTRLNWEVKVRGEVIFFVFGYGKIIWKGWARGNSAHSQRRRRFWLITASNSRRAVLYLDLMRYWCVRWWAYCVVEGSGCILSGFYEYFARVECVVLVLRVWNVVEKLMSPRYIHVVHTYWILKKKNSKTHR